METLVQILASGLTLGAMYAASAIGLSLVWGAMGVLNMAHGALLTIGGYASYSAVSGLGLPWFLGLPAAAVASFVVGLAIYHIIFRFMYRHPAFETNVIIATVGLAIFLEQVVLLIYGAYPFPQPFSIEEGFFVPDRQRQRGRVQRPAARRGPRHRRRLVRLVQRVVRRRDGHQPRTVLLVSPAAKVRVPDTSAA